MKRRIIALMFVTLGVFATQTVLAASISARVRILEKKVLKHDKQIRANSYGLKQQEKKLKAGLAKVEQLDKRVDRLEKDIQALRKPKEDKRYAFP